MIQASHQLQDFTCLVMIHLLPNFSALVIYNFYSNSVTIMLLAILASFKNHLAPLIYHRGNSGGLSESDGPNEFNSWRDVLSG